MAIFQGRSLQWCLAHQPVPRSPNKYNVSSYLTHSTLNMQWHTIKCPRKMYVPTGEHIESLRSLHLYEYKFALKLRVSSVQWAVYLALTALFDSSSPVQRTVFHVSLIVTPSSKFSSSPCHQFDTQPSSKLCEMLHTFLLHEQNNLIKILC